MRSCVRVRFDPLRCVCVRAELTEVRILNHCDGVAIADHETLQSPRISGEVLQQERVTARGYSIQRVVRAHDRTDFCVTDARLKRRQQRLLQVLIADHRVELESRDIVPVLQIVRRKMLAISDDLEVTIVHASLQSSDECEHVLTRQIGILTRRLLPSSPSRVSEQVDVRCEKRHAGLTHIVHRACLRRNGRRHGVDQLAREGRRHADRLRELRRAADGPVCEIDTAVASSDAVQSLAPPLVERDAEARNRRRLIAQPSDLLCAAAREIATAQVTENSLSDRSQPRLFPSRVDSTRLRSKSLRRCCCGSVWRAGSGCRCV